jgi:hypothetical protein
MARVKQPEEPAFDENDLGSIAENRFLSFVKKRYVRSFHGALHGTVWLAAMLLVGILQMANMVKSIRKEKQ